MEPNSSACAVQYCLSELELSGADTLNTWDAAWDYPLAWLGRRGGGAGEGSIGPKLQSYCCLIDYLQSANVQDIQEWSVHLRSILLVITILQGVVAINCINIVLGEHYDIGITVMLMPLSH